VSGFAGGSFGGGGGGGGGGTVNVGGDLSGTSAAAVVTRIQGKPVKNATPVDGQVLTYVAANSDWEPVTPSSSGSDADFGIYTCLSSAAVGQVVYLSAADTVGLANATDATKLAIGVISSKNSSTQAVVQRDGECAVFSGLTTGDIYYLDTTSGGITAIAPSASGNIVQKIGTAKDPTTLEMDISGDFTQL